MDGIEIVPVLSDNYSYVVYNDKLGECLVVDPSEPDKVVEIADKLDCKISCILTTHHHYDHSGGNVELGKLYGCPVYGGVGDNVPGVTREVSHDDTIDILDGEVHVLSTPCHTRGHVMYYIPSLKALFTGDTLFQAGCGRFFEGTAAQMHHALNHVVSNLPPDTLVYCGHEYTLNNLRFAEHVEPNNEAITKAINRSQSTRSNGLPTIPSTLQVEKATNPFMRVTQPQIQQFTGASDPIQVMFALRTAKNSFGLGSKF